MKTEIELRDLFAAELMSGKVDDFYSQAHRENISLEGETENWKQVSAAEATRRRVELAANNAYVIADALLKARKQQLESKNDNQTIKGLEKTTAYALKSKENALEVLRSFGIINK